MANEKNLKPYKKGELTSEEAKKRGKAGGLASVESRRRSKEMKTVLEYLMEKEIKRKDGGGNATTLEAICVAMVKEALDGSIRATEFIRDTLGQKPQETHVFKGGNGFSVTVEDEEHRKMLEEL